MSVLGRFSLFSLALAPLSVALAGPPTISACDDGDAPAAYDDETCHSTCTSAFNGLFYTVTCDIGDASPTVDGEIYAVYDYPDIAGVNFSAWGTRSDGVAFCCYIDDTDDSVNGFVLLGSSRDDSINFEESGGESMEDPTTGFFTAEAYGYGGNDQITGSDETEASFYESLVGGDGNDDIWGGTGDDTIEGNAGADSLYGEAGDDTLRGGSGADDLHGGGGDNTMCGGGGTSITGDTFSAVGGVQTIWEPYNALLQAPSASSIISTSSTCGHTSWGSTWAGMNCSYSLTSAPSGC